MASTKSEDIEPSATNEYASLHQQFTTVNDLRLCAYTNITPSNPLSSFSKSTILVLIHGYPQSPYEWRYLAPKLTAAGYPIFIPDLPGYANSPDRRQSLPQDKLSTGTAILTSLAQYLTSLARDSASSSKKVQELILITHDRGSRVGHRLSVSKPLSETFRIKAVTLIDIVPTSEQFLSHGRVPVAVGYFHWSMLANVDIATKLITALGGANWVRDMVGKMTKFPDTVQATEVYARQYDDEDVVRASCRDYEAAAKIDVAAQTEDMKAGRKLDVPALVFWSKSGLGSWHDVEGLWRRWMVEGIDVQFEPVGEGAGHYIPEDASESTGAKILTWLKRVDV